MITNLLTHPPRLPMIAPSVLSADFARLGEESSHALGAGADLLHLDVMDGHFVPNLTMGPDLCRGLSRAMPGAFLDVHLMVTDPGIYVEAFAKAGAGHVTLHVEVVPADGVRALVDRVRSLGMTAGLAINPPTPLESILPFVSLVDMVLVMSVNPGFSGQAFIPEVLSKVRRIAPLLRPEQRLEMDGGISPANARTVREAGCDVIVAASAIFGVPPARRGEAIRGLRES